MRTSHDDPLMSNEPAVKAFRLCINSDHCDRLLVENKWPAFVTVSEWFFKPVEKFNTQLNTVTKSSSSGVTGHARLLSDDVDTDAVAEAENMFVDVTVDLDIDKTIIMCDHSQGPSVQSADQPDSHR